jgi:antitoxin HicB
MSDKSVEYYTGLPYRVEVYPDEDGRGYSAVVPDLPGCMTSADTLEALWDMIEEAKELWLEVALADGDFIPEPAPLEVDAYSGKFVARLPRSLHRQLARRADQEGTSLNQLVVMLLSEGMGRWAERERPSAAGTYPYLQAGKSTAVHDKDG